MFKVLLVLSFIAFACAKPGVVVGTPVHVAPVVHHAGAHAVHSHVIHHPAPAKIVTPVVVKPVVPVLPVVKHVVPVVPVVKPVVPIVPVHHAHPAVVVHH
ncbi:uncharacterized protein [Eurosta solidaginis]|uniref:uncharacterized protein n=1 Tax=Eurosta solidaginis TaxID=178769 RepID=UPI003530D87D